MKHIATEDRPLPSEINSSNEKIAIMLLNKLQPLKEIRERSNKSTSEVIDELKDLPQIKIKHKQYTRPKLKLQNLLNRLTVSPSSLPFQASLQVMSRRVRTNVQTEHSSLIIKRESVNYLEEIKSDKMEEKKYIDVFNKAEKYLREKKNELKQLYLKQNGKTFLQQSSKTQKLNALRPIKLITNKQLEKMLLRDAKSNLQTMDISRWTKDIKRKRLMELKVKTQMMDH